MPEKILNVLGIAVPDESPLFLAIVAVHVLMALAAVIVGVAAMLAVKGIRRHSRLGLTYYWLMSGVFATATYHCAPERVQLWPERRLRAKREGRVSENPSIYEQRLKELEQAVLETSGSTSSKMRRLVAERAKRKERGAVLENDLPDWAALLADAVAVEPTRADVPGALSAGRSEDEVFEVVAAAALGVALTRAEAGRAALGKRKS